MPEVLSRSNIRARSKEEIRIDHVYPPIPIRDFDWAAYWDNDEPNDAGYMMTGYGRTPLAAIVDLLDQTEEKELEEAC